MDRSDLLNRLDAELSRVAKEAWKGERDARGLATRMRALAGVDIYGHPEAIGHLYRALVPEVLSDFLRDPKTMPPNAVGKYRDCWVFADTEQPEGALIIRLRGNVYADVPIAPTLSGPGKAET